MPNQPLRRSKRIAAKAMKDKEVVTDGNKIKHVVKESNTATSSSRRRSSRLRSRSRSRTKRRCSLQCLEENIKPTRQSPRRAKSQQKTTTKEKRGKAPQKSKRTTAISHVDSTSDETPSILQSATKSTSVSVTPNTVVVRSKVGVKFNLGRNSIVQFIKDDPPNIVEHLTDEIVAVSEELLPMDDDDDDETTRRNEELLAEWETNFDDLDTRQVSRRTIRRVSMSS